MNRTIQTNITSAGEILNRLEFPTPSDKPGENNDTSTARALKSRWPHLRDSNSGQNLDRRNSNTQAGSVDAAAATERSSSAPADVSPKQQCWNNSGEDLTVTTESDGVKMTSDEAEQDTQASARPDQKSKRMRAAEARRRLELIEEERELQDNLAEFWDSRFDKQRRWRPYLPVNENLEETPSR